MCTDDKPSGWGEISGVTAGATEKAGLEVVERGTGRLYLNQKRGSRMHTRFDIAAHRIHRGEETESPFVF